MSPRRWSSIGNLSSKDVKNLFTMIVGEEKAGNPAAIQFIENLHKAANEALVKKPQSKKLVPKMKEGSASSTRENNMGSGERKG